jgi:hypothetical protein
MSISPPGEICAEVVLAIQAVRLSFQSHTEITETLDAFWRLQDQLHRLVAEISDSPCEILLTLRSECPRLVQEIVELLTFTAKTRFAHIRSIQLSCATINDSLMELEQIKQLYAACAGNV